MNGVAVVASPTTVIVPVVGVVQVGAPPPEEVSTWPFVPAVVIAEILGADW